MGVYITYDHVSNAESNAPSAALLFEAGCRPGLAAVAELAESTGAFSISFVPSDDIAHERGPDANRWVELLVNGLTFDLNGLAPGKGSAPPPHSHAFGFANSVPSQVEALCLKPGPHLAAGVRVLPVLRALATLAANLAMLNRLSAVAWPAARIVCEPRHFRDSVLRWTEGGPFPAFCLAALAPVPDGGLQSEGLALFTGQELRLEPELVRDSAAAARIGVRLLHWLSERGRITAKETVTGPDGEPLRLELSANGRFVRAWRG
jgi:hypothetical protein